MTLCTEAHLLRLLSDCYGAMDGEWATLLPLFGVSAAFNAVDHEILTKRLSVSFGLSGFLLDWITSFLAGRSSCVVLGSSNRPSPVSLGYLGIQRDSFLAPFLYLRYNTLLI